MKFFFSQMNVNDTLISWGIYFWRHEARTKIDSPRNQRIVNIHSQQGLTLIEVLVALVIVSIAFGALFHSANVTLTSYQRMRDHVAGRTVATNILKMRELRVLFSQGERTQQGRQMFFDRNWFWTLSETSTNQPFIHRVHIEVRREENSDLPTVYQLDGFVYAQPDA